MSDVSDTLPPAPEPLSLDDAGERAKFLGFILLTIFLDTVFVVGWLLIMAGGRWVFNLFKNLIKDAETAFSVVEWIFFGVTLTVVSIYIIKDAWTVTKKIWRRQ